MCAYRPGHTGNYNDWYDGQGFPAQSTMILLGFQRFIYNSLTYIKAFSPMEMSYIFFFTYLATVKIQGIFPRSHFRYMFLLIND